MLILLLLCAQSRLYQVSTSLVRLPVPFSSPSELSKFALLCPGNWLFAPSPLLPSSSLPYLLLLLPMYSHPQQLNSGSSRWVCSTFPNFPSCFFYFWFFPVLTPVTPQTWDAPWWNWQQLRKYQAPDSFPKSGNRFRQLSVVVCRFSDTCDFCWPRTFLLLTGQDRWEVERPLHVGSARRTKEDVVVRRKKSRKLKIVRKFQVVQT